MRSSVRSRGFTLLELLVGAVVGSIVLLGISMTFISQAQQYQVPRQPPRRAGQRPPGPGLHGPPPARRRLRRQPGPGHPVLGLVRRGHRLGVPGLPGRLRGPLPRRALPPPRCRPSLPTRSPCAPPAPRSPSPCAGADPAGASASVASNYARIRRGREPAASCHHRDRPSDQADIPLDRPVAPRTAPRRARAGCSTSRPPRLGHPCFDWCHPAC